MNLFITGASGMVGKNLLESNPDPGKFKIYAKPSSELDLLDYSAVRRYLDEFTPDMIIHCAGKVGGIQANIKSPYDFCFENLQMGLNLVRAAKEVGVKKFINLSSSCAYPRDYVNPLKEEYTLKAELEPTNEGYALAKLSVLKLCEYISIQYPEFQYKTLIPCNLYGRFDKFGEENSHMIPGVIKKIHEAKMAKRKEVVIWGDGLARREFMYCGDLAQCIFRAIDNFETLPQLMNAGIGTDYTINEYYDAIKDVIEFEGHFAHDLSKPVGMKQKLLDVSRQKEWGWMPQTSLADGIRKTYDFFLKGI
jgi:GDP-L-fucose synthase